MEAQAATAPWVEFKVIAEEDRSASVEKGSYVAVDVDYAFITPAGSKDCVEKPVKEWFDSLRTQVENGRFPDAWFRAYQANYQAWREGVEMPIEGTSVKNWAVASPSQIEMLLKLRVRTVEQLASANEEVISRLGMGGRNLVEKAKAYVTQASSGIGKVAEENANLKQKLEVSEKNQTDMAAQLEMLKAQVAALQGQQPQAPGQVQTPTPNPTLADLIDPPATTTPRKL